MRHSAHSVALYKERRSRAQLCGCVLANLGQNTVRPISDHIQTFRCLLSPSPQSSSAGLWLSSPPCHPARGGVGKCYPGLPAAALPALALPPPRPPRYRAESLPGPASFQSISGDSLVAGASAQSRGQRVFDPPTYGPNSFTCDRFTVCNIQRQTRLES